MCSLPIPLELWIRRRSRRRVRGRRTVRPAALRTTRASTSPISRPSRAYLRTGTELPVRSDLCPRRRGGDRRAKACHSSFASGRRDLRCVRGRRASDRHAREKPACADLWAARHRRARNHPSRAIPRSPFGDLGGSIENPAMALCQLLAKLRDAATHHRPGFLQRRAPLSAAERRQFKPPPRNRTALPPVSRRAAALRGDWLHVHRTHDSPTDVRDQWTHQRYQGEGGKTIVPAWRAARSPCGSCPTKNPDAI